MSLLRCMSLELALTDDYVMSPLTVAIWANRTRYAQRATFLRMTDAVEKVLVIIDES
jgi:hypothetical protein